jgi:hypothetical protein
VYVYRDTGGQPGDPVAAGGSGENDAAYWYDLPVTGSGQDGPAHVVEETRGPFEPLVSSADPPGATPHFSAGPDADAFSPDTAEPFTPDLDYPDEAPRNDGQEDTAHAHARKLEQIKDLYLTAEAIGESNVDKHFDQLLAQQRELISEYFKHSSAATPAAGSSQAAAAADSAEQTESDPGALRDPGPPAGGPAGAPENARVAADQPRIW